MPFSPNCSAHTDTTAQGKNQPAQPIQIVISSSGQLNPDLRFFQQPAIRWLVTTITGANFWQGRPEFAKLLVIETPTTTESGGKIECTPVPCSL